MTIERPGIGSGWPWAGVAGRPCWAAAGHGNAALSTAAAIATKRLRQVDMTKPGLIIEGYSANAPTDAQPTHCTTRTRFRRSLIRMPDESNGTSLPFR